MGTILSPCPGHPQEVVSVEEYNPLHTWSNAVPRQHLHTTPLLQGVIGFLEVKEDLIEDCLTCRLQLLEQLDF